MRQRLSGSAMNEIISMLLMDAWMIQWTQWFSIRITSGKLSSSPRKVLLPILLYGQSPLFWVVVTSKLKKRRLLLTEVSAFPLGGLARWQPTPSPCRVRRLVEMTDHLRAWPTKSSHKVLHRLFHCLPLHTEDSVGDTEVLQKRVHGTGGTWVPGWPCGQDSPLTKTPIRLNMNEE